MLLRRVTPVVLLAAAIACEPSTPPANNPALADYAAFDPNGAPSAGIPQLVPTPNDIVWQQSSIDPLPASAQKDLLTYFNSLKGFPNDQELPITIQFVRITFDPATQTTKREAPPIDPTTVNQSNVRLIGISASGAGLVNYDPPQASDYAVVQEAGGGAHGELTLHRTPAQPGATRAFDPGTYVFAVHGGPAGLKTKDGHPIGQQAVMYLLTQDVDLTSQNVLPLIPGSSYQQKLATAEQLDTLRKQLRPALQATQFPFSEIATAGAFTVVAAPPHVVTDASAGIAPLPSDLLLGPDGKLQPALAAPTGPFGPLGPGLATLDGFSTTAMVLMNTSAPVLTKTITKDTVYLVEIGPTGGTPAPRKVLELTEALGSGKTPEYLDEPTPITQDLVSGKACASASDATCVSTAIGLQPAIPVPVQTSLVSLPPLKEGTTYAVVITNGVQSFTGPTTAPAPLGRSTVGTLITSTNPLAKDGKSLVAGVSDAQAGGLEQMRSAVGAAIKATGVNASNVVMGYTFHTQTMKGIAGQLAALPYANGTSDLGIPGDAPAAPAVYCNIPQLCGTNDVATAFTDHGIDPSAVGSGTAHIGSVIDVYITTYNKLDDAPGYNNGGQATGAFTPASVAPTKETIPALIVTPAISSNCTPVPAAPGQWSTTCNAPLLVFRHGLGSSRNAMLLLADTFAAKGYVVVAIDAAKHGDRSFCDASKATSDCVTACQPDATLATEGDASVPGRCTGGQTQLRRVPLGGVCTSGPCTAAPKGQAAASGNYLVSVNLFRTRDSLRQDIIDESQLIRVMSPNPAAPTQGLLWSLSGYVVDLANIHYISQSLGSISGTSDVAANPRISKAVLNVGGGTIVDVITSPMSGLSIGLNQLLTANGIVPGTAGYLQFLQVSKWVLDPADPINFATNVKTAPLTTPLGASSARKVLKQVAQCDHTVPMVFGLHLGAQLGVGLATGNESIFTSDTNGTAGPQFCPTDTPSGGTGAVPHTFLLDWQSTLTAKAQQQAADFLHDDAAAAPVVTP